MPFDTFTLQAVIEELRATILGGKVREISQPEPYEVAFKVSVGGRSEHLLISADPDRARTHLTHSLPKSSSKDSHFANYLHTHLIRNEISQISQIGLDRILKVSFKPVSDFLKIPPKAIIAEFMGKHSNIILIDESTNKILQPIKVVDESVNRYRQLLPGLGYVPPPPQEKLNPYEVSESQFSKLVESGSNLETWRVLLNNLSGFSPALAKEVVARSKIDRISLWQAWNSILSDFLEKKYRPTVVLKSDDPSVPVDVFPISPRQFSEVELAEFSSISSALDRYYNAVSERDWLEAEKRKLTQALSKKRKSIAEKLDDLLKKLHDSEKADEYRIMGELLTANLHRVERGQKEVEVGNYYDADEGKLSIPLDPSASPSQNAQQYFKKYTKAKRSKSAIANLIVENEALLKTISHLLELINSSQSRAELESIRGQLESKSLIKPAAKKRQKEKEKPTFRAFTSPNDYQIYVGRSNAENDFLTMKVASNDDVWLHAKGIPGSHVIVRNPERKGDIPMPTLFQAAQIAAYFSRAQNSSHVPVDYTWIKYVSKPKGSKPGYVTYTREKTLFVEPKKPERK